MNLKDLTVCKMLLLLSKQWQSTMSKKNLVQINWTSLHLSLTLESQTKYLLIFIPPIALRAKKVNHNMSKLQRWREESPLRKFKSKQCKKFQSQKQTNQATRAQSLLDKLRILKKSYLWKSQVTGKKIQLKITVEVFSPRQFWICKIREKPSLTFYWTNWRLYHPLKAKLVKAKGRKPFRKIH